MKHQVQITDPTKTISPRQLEVLNQIAMFEESRCYSPTIAELAGKLSVSRTTVFEHIDALRRKGLLRSSKGRARSLRLTARASQLLKKDAEIYPEGRSEGLRLLGRVAAGVPIEAIENSESLSLRSMFGDVDDMFALEVSGDSMIDEGIYTGDLVICRKASAAYNGQMVVAIVDNENATLKRFYKEDERVRLEAANPAYEPIYSENCRIEAVVVGMLRRL